MAGTLLVGLLVTEAFSWWWADSIGALALLYWLGREAREALEGARAAVAAAVAGTRGAPAHNRKRSSDILFCAATDWPSHRHVLPANEPQSRGNAG